MKTDLSPDKERALDTVISQIDRQFGKGSIMRLGESAPRMEVGVIPTGSITVDVATGIGGIPRGRITEIFGPESSGKTTLVQHAIAEAQKLGGVAAFIDAEHVFDYEYAKKCGVQVEELYISQPDTGEQALEIAEALVRSGAPGHRSGRLGRGAGSAQRAGWRDGRLSRRAAGSADVAGAAQAKPGLSTARIRRWSLPTSCVRRSAFSSEIRRLLRAAGRSSSTRRCDWTYAGSNRSSTAARRSAAGRG